MTEGASAEKVQLAPSGPLGHLPRAAGEELLVTYPPRIAGWNSPAGEAVKIS